MQIRRVILSLLLAAILMTAPAQAAEADTVRCFSAAQFGSGTEELLGICITDFSGENCSLRLGPRLLAAGDVLTQAQLEQLTAENRGPSATVGSLSYLPVYAGGPGPAQTMQIPLRGTVNQPPSAPSLEIETYKNLAVTESLHCEDPDGDTMTFEILRSPRRGTVTIGSDGSFTYTPKPEKVGADHFTYIAADENGNRSAETTVSIRILNAAAGGVFADMTGDPNEREALFLRCSGLLSGEYVAGTLCFCPERTVSYEEFLMMAMKLAELAPMETADPHWFAPWQTAALRAGLPRGAEQTFTGQAAAMLTAALLDLPEEAAVAVFSAEDGAEPLTRRDAAVLLYALSRSGAACDPS